ncbi:MAG: hypothetical protein ACHP84_03105 [Caulobacterales bacterium]
MSRHKAAAVFSVGVSSVIRWRQRKRARGSVKADPVGGKVKPKLEGERAWILARVEGEPSLKTFPDQPQGWLLHGNGLRTLGRIDEAIAAYRTCIELREVAAWASRRKPQCPLKRIPGPSSGVPTNSMPAASNAAVMAIRVLTRL